MKKLMTQIIAYPYMVCVIIHFMEELINGIDYSLLLIFAMVHFKEEFIVPQITVLRWFFVNKNSAQLYSNHCSDVKIGLQLQQQSSQKSLEAVEKNLASGYPNYVRTCIQCQIKIIWKNNHPNRAQLTQYRVQSLARLNIIKCRVQLG